MPKNKINFRLIDILKLGCYCDVKTIRDTVFLNEYDEFMEWIKNKRSYGNIDSVKEVLLEDVYIYKKMMKIRYSKSKIDENSLSDDEKKAKEINKVISMEISRDEKIRLISEINNKYEKKCN